MSGSQQTITFSAVGDVRPQRERLGNVGAGSALHRLAADIVHGNLEVVLTPPLPGAAKLVVARAEPAAVGVLSAMKFDAMSLANNHTLDFGLEGFANMCALLERNGIPYTGAGPNSEAAWRPFVIERGGIKVALLAIAGTVPSGFAAAPHQPGIAGFKVETSYKVEPGLLFEEPGSKPWVQTSVPPEEVAKLERAVADARARADVVVVSVHWGVCYQDETAEYQRQVAKVLAKAGAALVVGHHPHQLQGVGMEAGVPVVYSLGDFLTHFRRPKTAKFPGLAGMDPVKASRSLIARATLSKSGVERLELVPVILDEQGEPRIATDAEADALFDWIGRLSEPLGGALASGAGGARVLVAAQGVAA